MYGKNTMYKLCTFLKEVQSISTIPDHEQGARPAQSPSEPTPKALWPLTFGLFAFGLLSFLKSR